MFSDMPSIIVLDLVSFKGVHHSIWALCAWGTCKGGRMTFSRIFLSITRFGSAPELDMS